MSREESYGDNFLISRTDLQTFQNRILKSKIYSNIIVALISFTYSNRGNRFSL